MIVVHDVTICSCYSLFLVVYSSLDLCCQCSLPISSTLNKGYLSVSKDMLYHNFQFIHNKKRGIEYKYTNKLLKMIFIYISAGVFLTGILMLIAFSILTTQPTLVMYILSSFLIICGIFMAFLFIWLDYWKWNSKMTPEKQELIPLETAKDVETL